MRAKQICWLADAGNVPAIRGTLLCPATRKRTVTGDVPNVSANGAGVCKLRLAGRSNLIGQSRPVCRLSVSGIRGELPTDTFMSAKGSGVVGPVAGGGRMDRRRRHINGAGTGISIGRAIEEGLPKANGVGLLLIILSCGTPCRVKVKKGLKETIQKTETECKSLYMYIIIIKSISHYKTLFLS